LGVWAPLFGASAETVVQPRLELAIEERYDDDVLLREAGDFGAELMTKLTPRAGLDLTSRNLELKSWYAADLQARHLSRTLNLDHRGGLELEHRLSPLTRTDLTLDVWRVSDPTSLPRMGVSRTMSPVLYGRAQVGLTSRLTRRWEGRLQYAAEATQVFHPDTPPGASHAPSAEAWYRLTPRANAGVGYRFQYFQFGPDNALAHTPQALYRYRWDELTTATVRAGPVVFSEVGRLPAVAPAVTLNVFRRVRRFDFGLSVGQDVVGASGFSSAVWAQYGSVMTTWRVLERLRFNAAASVYRNGDAPGSFEAYVTPGGPEISSGYAVGLGAEWELNRYVSLEGQLNRVAQVGAFEHDGDLTRNIAAMRLVLRAW